MKIKLEKEIYWNKIMKGWQWMFVICIACIFLVKFLLKNVFIMYFFFMTGITSLLLSLISSIFYYRAFIKARKSQGLTHAQALERWNKRYPPS
jgi:hypothetical protein